MISFETTFLDYPNPDDIAVVVIMSGCIHNCLGCQNPKLQKLHEPFINDFKKEIINHIKDLCKRNETNKIVLSGGDPLCPCNGNLTIDICRELGNNGYEICIYTGYNIEEVKEMGLNGFTFIKCGKFDAHSMRESKKTDEYIQFVNKTQNLFDSKFNQISKDGIYYFNKTNGAKHD